MRTVFALEGVPGAAAVTIDDGPNPHTTAALLDVLSAYGATANFFACGLNLEKFPDLAERIVAAGHGLFSHGYDHRAFDTLDGAAIRSQLERTEALLSRHRPPPSPYPLRLPFGAGWDVPMVAAAVSDWRADVVAVQWGVCAQEWTFMADCRTPDAIARSCRDAVERLTAAPWEQALILLHDWPPGDNGNGPLTAAFCATLLEQYLIGLRRAKLAPLRLPLGLG